jgi:Na+-driven multidrug efflux pump
MYIKAYGLLGSAALESYKVAYSVSMIPYVITFGLGNACAFIIGERLGRKDLQGAKDTVRCLLPISVVAAGVVTLVMVVLARPAVGLFQLSSPELQDSTVLMTRLFAIRIATRLFNVIFLFTMRAGGDAMFLMFLDCGVLWLLGVPLAFAGVYLLHIRTIGGLFALLQLEQVVRMGIGYFRYRKGTWCRNLTVETQRKA